MFEDMLFLISTTDISESIVPVVTRSLSFLVTSAGTLSGSGGREEGGSNSISLYIHSSFDRIRTSIFIGSLIQFPWGFFQGSGYPTCIVSTDPVL